MPHLLFNFEGLEDLSINFKELDTINKVDFNLDDFSLIPTIKGENATNLIAEEIKQQFEDSSIEPIPQFTVGQTAVEPIITSLIEPASDLQIDSPNVSQAQEILSDSRNFNGGDLSLVKFMREVYSNHKHKAKETPSIDALLNTQDQHYESFSEMENVNVLETQFNSCGNVPAITINSDITPHIAFILKSDQLSYPTAQSKPIEIPLKKARLDSFETHSPYCGSFFYPPSIYNPAWFNTLSTVSNLSTNKNKFKEAVFNEANKEEIHLKDEYEYEEEGEEETPDYSIFDDPLVARTNEIDLNNSSFMDHLKEVDSYYTIPPLPNYASSLPLNPERINTQLSPTEKQTEEKTEEQTEKQTEEPSVPFKTLSSRKRSRSQSETTPEEKQPLSLNLPSTTTQTGPIKKRIRYNDCNEEFSNRIDEDQKNPQEHEVLIFTHSREPALDLPKFWKFRIFNNIVWDSFIEQVGNQPTGDYSYEPNIMSSTATDYTPIIYRKKRDSKQVKEEKKNNISISINDEFLKELIKKQEKLPSKSPREGLCPYCPFENINGVIQNFFDLNTSQYATHMLSCHGIFTTGTLVLDPEVYRIGVEMKSGKESETECVQCPYPDCYVNIKLGKQSGAKKFTTYFRHVKVCHRDKKNHRRS